MSIDRRFLRHYVILGAIVLVAIVTLFRYGRLALGTGPGTGAAAPRVVSIRGSIFDREGRLLAAYTDLYDVSVWRPSVTKGREPDFAHAIAAALDVPEDSILARLAGDGPDFVYLARRISGEVAKAVERAAESTGMHGLSLDRVAGRVYPERALASHLIGFVGTENKGLAGAEVSFESVLAPDVSKASAGYAYGDSVYLTIDADLQYRLEQLGRAALKENAAEGIALVVMEAHTGAILGYGSLPDFDPNNFLAADRSTWVDRVSIYAYEPGSVSKTNVIIR